jgi:hypothetical protein
VKTEVRRLLDELTADQPEPTDDLNRLIDRGRRRGRVRTAAAGALGLTLAVGLTGGVLALRPDASDLPAAGQPSAVTAKEPTQRAPFTSKSTQKSKELARQLQHLAPEIGQIPGARMLDEQLFMPEPDGSRTWLVRAGSGWRYPVGKAENIVDLTVEVGAAGQVPSVCDGMTPGVNQCTEVRRLPDGSTAYIHNFTAQGGHQYDVRLVRPDNTWVFVGSGAQMPPGSTHDAPVPAERVLEIAQQITIRP